MPRVPGPSWQGSLDPHGKGPRTLIPRVPRPLTTNHIHRGGVSGAYGATTKTDVVANRYRDYGRVNSLEGLMLTHRPCESSRLKACGFCHTLRHESPTGHESVSFGDLHEKCNSGEALYNLRRESVLEFEFEKGMVKIPFSHSNL